MFLISDLCAILEKYLNKEDVAFVYRAYLFGAEAHEGQTRKSGEPYIYHPIAVARILAEMRMDSQTLAAAILHDVIEDTPTAKEQIAQEFGQSVAEIVDGVTKLDHLNFHTRAEAKAESFRKLLLSMVNDIRVILIKLADRLHNMRTLGAMPKDKARAIAAETLEIYAPIANRLGMNNLRHELEDLGFKNHNPMRYRILEREVQKYRGHRKEIVDKILCQIKERLDFEKIDSEVIGREKHLYSIYHKMRKKQLPFYEIFDVYAFRIIVNTVDQCYRALGVVHALYKPVPGKFKDYIAIPKINGYQSLHSVLFSSYGVPIEVQIRTCNMHKIAEQGVASHWMYKMQNHPINEQDNENDVLTQSRTREWLKSILELQQNTGDSIEFLENVKIDLFPDEVYVFTPKGKIMELPQGATTIDFAYAVHTDIGNHCTAARVDHKLVPLNTELKNGNTVEIITSDQSFPNPAWLNFVVSAKARSNIRSVLKKIRKEESIVLGERLLNQALSQYDLDLLIIEDKDIQRLLQEYQLERLEHLLLEIGTGSRIAQLVARRLVPKRVLDEQTDGVLEKQHKLDIKGSEGIVVSYGKCCHPIPGDPIVAFISKGKGLVVHHKQCSNAQEILKKPDNWVEVQWSDEVIGEFSVALRLLAQHQRGVIAKVSAIISESGANIEQLSTTPRDGNFYFIDFILTVHNRKHLAMLIRKLRILDFIAKVNRIY